MPEDKIDIDSKKFETEAFSAIDKLLPEESENEEEALKEEVPSGIDETLSKETEESGPLLGLDKVLLGLDWEVSDSTLREIFDIVEGLKRVYPDEVSYALLSMMSSLVKFLNFARHMSPPGTIKLVGKIADVFKEINTSTLSLEERKLKVQEIYDEFLSFKKEAEKVKKEEAKISPMLGEELSNLKAEFFAFKEGFGQLQSKLSQATDSFTHQNDILEKINVKSENFSSQLEKVIKEIAELKVNMEEIGKSVLPLPKVVVAFIDGQPIAFPERCVANVYKVSLSKSREIKQRDHISLSEIKSAWKALKAGIKGSLSKLKEEELGELEVPVLKSPMGEIFAMEECVYKALVLLEEDEKYGLLLGDKAFSRKAINPVSGRKGREAWMDRIIEVPKMGEVPLVDVKNLFGK